MSGFSGDDMSHTTHEFANLRDVLRSSAVPCPLEPKPDGRERTSSLDDMTSEWSGPGLRSTVMSVVGPIAADEVHPSLAHAASFTHAGQPLMLGPALAHDIHSRMRPHDGGAVSYERGTLLRGQIPAD